MESLDCHSRVETPTSAMSPHQVFTPRHELVQTMLSVSSVGRWQRWQLPYFPHFPVNCLGTAWIGPGGRTERTQREGEKVPSVVSEGHVFEHEHSVSRFDASGARGAQGEHVGPVLFSVDGFQDCFHRYFNRRLALRTDVLYW